MRFFWMLLYPFFLAAVTPISDANYRAEVLDSKLPVVLDAYTDWCGYCKKVAPTFAELSEEMQGKVKFVKLNIEASPYVADELKIDALPTFVFYKNGKIVGRQAGALDKHELQSRIKKYF